MLSTMYGTNGNGMSHNTSRKLDKLIDVLNATASARQEIFRTMKGQLDPRRDIYEEAGYPQPGTVRPEDYWDLYEREAIAGKVVEIVPRETWQVQPTIYETEDADNVTEFEKAWDELGAGLRAMNSGTMPDALDERLRKQVSWYMQEGGSPIWEYMLRADILSGVGRYAVILLGLDDGLPLWKPARGVIEENSVGSGMLDGKKLESERIPGLYALNINARQTRGRKLRYLRVFPEVNAPISEWETNWSSPRFGQPLYYDIRIGIDTRGHVVGASSSAPYFTKKVHWSRVIHIADNLRSSEVYGVPRQEPVLNNILAIQKISCGDPEMYWKAAFMGLLLETPPNYEGDLNEEKIKDMIEDWQNGIQRVMTLRNLSGKPLAPAVADPRPHIEVQTELIAMRMNIPIRILKGSERGELASSQDERQWQGQIKGRQWNKTTPRDIVPFVDRLIMVGVLPEPAEGWKCDWPDIASKTDKEKAEIASLRMSVFKEYVTSGAESIIPPFDFLTREMYYDEEEANAILEAAKAAQGDDADMSGGSPLLSLVGGITGMLELFQKFKDGALSEESLKQLIMLFYKVSEDKAEDIIADGLPEPPTPALPAIPPLRGGPPPRPDGPPPRPAGPPPRPVAPPPPPRRVPVGNKKTRKGKKK